MNITIHANHFEMTDAIRDFVNEKVEGLKKYFDNIIDVDVFLNVEKYRQTAEVTLHANNITLVAKEVSNDMYNSITRATGKIAKQLKKYKGKKNNKKEKMATKDIFASEIISPEEPEKYENISVEIYSPKAMIIDEAIEYLQTEELDFLAFTDVSTNEINILKKREDNKYHLVKLAKEEE
jgi:putative sigma-54 modulation protein